MSISSLLTQNENQVELVARSTPAPLPLRERSDRIADATRVRGMSPRVQLKFAETTPHPARAKVCATFSHKGRMNGARGPTDWTHSHHALSSSPPGICRSMK